MGKPVVAILKYDNPYQTLRETLRLCNGLTDFRTEDKILIKPNLVGYDFDYPLPFGMITTSAVVETLVKILFEEGFRHITIGEAPLTIRQEAGKLPRYQPYVREVYRVLGYEKLREKYGVELIDFNEEEFVPLYFGDFHLSVAKRAMEVDKIINVPVLKTHNQCKVSLGVKNVKGFLSRKSKEFCHGKELEQDLDRTFNYLIEKLPVALTVIDGIFVNPRGAVANSSTYRKDLIIASQDTYACDLVGAEIMGYRIKDVPHLLNYAVRNGRSLELADIELQGEDINRLRNYEDFDQAWLVDDTGPEGLAKRGIKGLAIRKWDNSLCTGCSQQYTSMVVMLMSAFERRSFPSVEVITGKRKLASPGFDISVLFGKCPIVSNKDNPNVNQVIKVKGCPPDMDEFIRAMSEMGIFIDKD